MARQTQGIGVVPAYRGAVLSAYALLAACTQLLWLSFAAIDRQTGAALQVDVGAIGDLAAIFPLAYIILALPTGSILDTRFGLALALGAGFTAAGAVFRLLAPASYEWQRVGMIVIAIGQPFV